MTGGPRRDPRIQQVKEANQAKERLAAEARAKQEKEAAIRSARQKKTAAYWAARERAVGQLMAGRIISDLVLDQDGHVLGDSSERTPVAFWGICDLKYDSRKPMRERLKVLELGDSRSSQFSHHGSSIKTRFNNTYFVKDVARRQLLVDNKRIMHDAFVQCGLEELRPAQFLYPKQYDPTLADRIRSDLKVSDEGLVVLKLINRSRGAGVVICPVAKLDETLKLLLRPPGVGNGPAGLEQWLIEHAPRALEEPSGKGVVAEHQLHYWCNESPNFVVEELCCSVPVLMETSSSAVAEVFDGTMRVSYVLRRRTENKDIFDIEWLGGYWKLPSASTECASSTIEHAHNRWLSSFNTEEKRTEKVSGDHLRDVYATLTPALTAVFAEEFGYKELLHAYPEDPNFQAFCLCRFAASLRSSEVELDRCNQILIKTRNIVKMPATDASRGRTALSYIERTQGVNRAVLKDWTGAESHFDKALELLPTNATAYYLKGRCLQEQDRHSDASDCFLRSLALDPDFRSPSMSLAESWARLGFYDRAVAACHATLHRQPDAPLAQFIMGHAIYQQLHEGDSTTRAKETELRAKALRSLSIAKEGNKERWNADDDEVVRQLEGDPGSDLLPRVPLRTASTFGWRP